MRPRATPLIAAIFVTPWRGSEAREKVKEGATKAGAVAKEGAAKAALAAREGAAAVGKAAKEKTTELVSRAKSEDADKEDSEAD